MKSSQLKGKGNRPTTTGNKPDLRKLYEKDKDTHFSYNMTVLIGCSAEVTTRSGEKYEGIFVAYSSSQEIMLEAAHLITNENDESAISTHYDVLIIPSDKLMAMKFENAVLSYATQEFQTDAAITANRSTNVANRELTPWDGGELEEAVEDLDLSGNGGTNGWAPGDMFKKNAEKYGVVSSYDQQLSGYTTSLDKTDTETFKKHEEQAIQIAEEIEKSTTSIERITVENGEDEEEKFSAVVRDTNNYSNLNNNNNNSISSGNEIRSEKYVPPSRRNQNTQSTNSPSVNCNSSSTPVQQQQQQQTGGSTRKPNYGGQRNNFTPPANSFYQQDTRRNFDRRVQVQTHYGPLNHGEGNRPGRSGKVMDRRGPRDEPVKKELMEFHSSFNLCTESTPNRRQISSGPTNAPHQIHGPPQSINPTQRGPNPSPSPSTTQKLNQSNQKTEREKVEAPLEITDGPDGVKVEKHVKTPPPQLSECKGRKPAESPEAAIESGPEEKSAHASPTLSETRSVASSDKGDSKSIDSVDSNSKPRPFAFNVNAKEFNPNAKSFTPRSPATPPRPPSTPASTPQPMPTAAQGYPYIQMQQAIFLSPSYSQPTISPVASQGLSSTNLPPQRHMNQHRKNIGVTQRSDLALPSLPVATGGPLLTQGSIPNSGSHPQYTTYGIPHQHGGYPQPLRIHPSNIVPMYNSESGGGGNPIHMPLHYLHATNAAGHPSNQPSVNPTGQSSAISGSPHGYTQSGGNHGPQPHHLPYPFMGLPLVGYPHALPHGPTPLLTTRFPEE